MQPKIILSGNFWAVKNIYTGCTNNVEDPQCKSDFFPEDIRHFIGALLYVEQRCYLKRKMIHNLTKNNPTGRTNVEEHN